MSPDTLQPVPVTLEEILSATTELPVLPQVAVKIFEEMRSPNITAARMAEFIKKDPVLATAVLRVANSALYGARGRINDLAFAIARVGLSQIRNLLLALVLRSQMSDPQVYGCEGAPLMEHGLATAFGAGLVADVAAVDSGQAFMCGLLHDFGKLALIKALREREGVTTPCLPDDLAKVVDQLHAEAGEMLCRKWELPEAVALVARYHHEPDGAPEDAATIVATVSFADALSHRLGLGRPQDAEMNLLEHPAGRMLGIGEAKVKEIEEHLPGLFGMARSALFV
ncbi:MAG TPA: HDOD domain-containing protein [Acidobacteria bacterium]|nr:HDOD domain-containing protein [Acidobacteriota bacterium]